VSHEAEHMSEWWKDDEQLQLFEARAKAGGMSRRTMLGIIGAFAGGAALAACGGGDKKESSPPSGAAGGSQAGAAATAAPGEKLAKEQTFKFPLDTEPTTLDYNKDLYAGAFSDALSGLLQFDENFQVKPDMAESFTTNANGDVYTFKIRRDSKWSNGDPVTAKDFEWSWKRNLDPATAATYAGFLFDIKNAEAFNSKKIADASQVGVKAVDDQTLEVTLEGPRGYFPALVAYIAAVPAHRASVEKQGDKYGQDAATFVSNGPFKVTKWEKEKSLEALKNEGYWDAKNVNITKLTVLRIPANGQLLAYENDEIDYFDRVPFGDLKRLQADSKLSKELFKFSVVGVWYLMPNPNFKPFDLKEVRLAMAHAIDREKIAKDVFQGASQAAYTQNPPGTPGYNPNKYEQYTKYEGKDALKYLQGTPYEGGRNWPKITMTQRVEGDVDATAAQAMIQMLKDNLNMTVEHEVGDRRETYARMYQNKIQLMWIRWYMDYPDPNNNNWQLFYSKIPESARRSHWVNPDYDRLVDQAKGEKDQEKRKQLYAQSDEVLAKDAGAIFVHWPYRFGMIKPYLKGMPVNKQGEPVPHFNIFVRMREKMRVLEH
jgi:oligopeptide transport system substrate-binding protein